MRSRIGLFVALLSLVRIGTSDAQTRIVTGKVVDSLTGEAVTSGQVVVVGTTITSAIKEDGTFTVAVPPRDVSLSVRSIGFKRRDVNVPASSNSVQTALERDYFQLEAIVVTGQATGIERRNLANSVASVSAAEMTKSPVASVDQALQGKLAGAQIMANNGAPGGGVRVRLRGVTSVTGENQPLYVVDGIIMSNQEIAPGTNVVTRASGGAATAGRDAGTQESPVNRVADLNPNDIENVEVLKGAAASAIYGSKASNGVIIITTKRGRVGAPQFSVSQRFGVPQLSSRIGYRRFPDSLSLAAAFPPARTQDWWNGPNYEGYDHEDFIYNNHPLNYETSLSVNGGTETTRYFVSGNIKHEGGIVTRTFADKQSVRINIDQQVGSRLTFSANTQVVRNENDRGFTGNDNSSTSYGMTINKIPNVIDLRAVCADGSRQARCPNDDGVYPFNPFIASNPLQTAAYAEANDQVWRSILGGRMQLDAINTAAHTLKLLANAGADVFTQKDVVSSPSFLQFEPADGRVGTYALAYAQNLNLNLNTNLVHTFKPVSGAFSANTSVGFQFESRDYSRSQTLASNLLGGVLALNAGTVQAMYEEKTRVEDFGFFAQEEFLTLGEKLLLTVGIRADKSSNNGDPNKLFYYPKAAASYRFTAMPGPFDEVKLRAAFGQSGNQPKYGDKFTNLTSAQIDGLGTFAQSTSGGASTLSPERQREIEAGFDATMFGSRTNIEFTVFEKRITDLMLNRELAPTTGFTQERFNGGTLWTRGLELSVNLVPLQTATTTWTTRINFAKSRSKVVSLETAPFQVSSYQTGAFWIREGESPTALWANDTVPGSFANFLAGRPIVVEPRVIGEMTPDFNLGFSNDITWKAVSLYALWDWQQGGMLAAGTWRHNDLSLNAPDHDMINPVTKPLYEAENARRVALGQPGFPTRTLGQERVDWYRQVTAVYFKDASFLKLREVQLTFSVPQAMVQKVWSGARYVRLGLSGRNLVQITPYRGGDPEAATFSFNTTLPGARELGAYPPSRSFWVNIDVGF